MDKGGCILFLSIALDIGDQEARSSSLRGLSLRHKLMGVDLSETRNEPSLYVMEGRWHVLINIGDSTGGFGIEFQLKTLRSTGVPGLTVICDARVESVGGSSKKGGRNHAKGGTEPGGGCRLWSVDRLGCRPEGTSGEPSEICRLRISPRETGGSCETSTISDALSQISFCLCSVELRARESGEDFEPIGNDRPDSWTSATGIAGEWVSDSVALFSKEEPVLCMLSEWEWSW
jgi:hypothetical protein